MQSIPSKLHVTVDTREKVALFNEICRVFPDVEFTHKKLGDGDYFAESEAVLVERKTIHDLWLSIMGEKQKNGRSRMANEVDRLATHEDKLILFLIIGSITDWISSMDSLLIPVDPSIVYAELASLMTREKFHVMWAPTEKSARITMVQFMLAVHNGKYGWPARRDPEKLMARVLKITPAQYKKLKEKFKTINNIANQKPENLTVIPGIGPARANFIIEMLNG